MPRLISVWKSRAHRQISSSHDTVPSYYFWSMIEIMPSGRGNLYTEKLFIDQPIYPRCLLIRYSQKTWAHSHQAKLWLTVLLADGEVRLD